MRKLVFASMLALASVALLSQFSSVARAADLSVQSGSLNQEASIDIGRVKSALKLRPEQERYWQPVEAALRGIAHQQAHSDSSDGFMRRVSRRVVSIVVNSAAVERLVVAARPLIAKLDDQQKQAAGQLAQEMGLGAVVMAALN